MTDAPINLNKVRKARARDAERKRADENSVKHGRSKAERLLEATRNRRAQMMLDQARLEEDS